MQKVTVSVEGMMCSMCESHVNEAVRKALGVDRVMSSHTKGETVILTEKPLTEEAIRAAIDPTGYTVKAVREEPYEKKGLFSRLFGK